MAKHSHQAFDSSLPIYLVVVKIAICDGCLLLGLPGIRPEIKATKGTHLHQKSCGFVLSFSVCGHGPHPPPPTLSQRSPMA